MDELKIKLATKFTRGIVQKLIEKAIFKKFGCKINLQLTELDVNFIDGKAHIHTNVDAEINNEEFTKILKSIDI